MMILCAILTLIASGVCGYIADIHGVENASRFWFLGCVTGIVVGLLISASR